MEKNKWRNRDWGWVVAILVSIIILILTIRLGGNKDVINLFSFISSSVSIALAVVAIFIALKQDSEGRKVHEQLVSLLSGIQTDVKVVDAKLDPTLVSSVGEQTAQAYTQEIKQKEKNTYTKNEVDEIINKVSKDVALNISEVINEENKINLSKDEKKQLMAYVEIGIIDGIIKDNPFKTPYEIRDMIEEETGKKVPMAVIMQKMHSNKKRYVANK